MWLMTSKGRAKAAEEVMQACWDTGMRQKAILYVDGPMAGYDKIKLPDNWSLMNGTGNLAGSYNEIVKEHNTERCYGWMADDNIPITPYWSYIIEEVCGTWHFVHCKDDWVSAMNEQNREMLYQSRNMGGGMCWGGDLMRCVGYWAMPGVVQAGIDWMWTALIGGTPIGVYLHNVTVKHNNFRTGRRPKDKTDEWGAWMQPDIDKTSAFIKSEEFKQLRKKVLNAYYEAIRSRHS